MTRLETKKHTIIYIVGIALVIVTVAASIRIVQLNTLWPSPTQVEYGIGEWVCIGTLNELGQIDDEKTIDIQATSVILADYEKVQEIFPDFEIRFSNAAGEPLSSEQFRVLLVEVEARNTSLGKREIAFSQFIARSQVWRNGLDMFLFHDLNGNTPIVLELGSGETARVTLPFIMIEQQFDGVSWNQIDRRSFDLVLELYPVLKIIKL